MSRISLVIPCHNVAEHIEETLRSALDQTLAPDEIILVDDGSTDDTSGVIKRFIDSHESSTPTRMILVEQTNAGVSKARNVGIDRATGEAIAFLDGDDLFLPTKLEKQQAALEAAPDAAGVFCDLFQFCQTLDDLGREEIQHVTPDPDVRHILLYQTVVMSTVMVRRSALARVRFDETTGHGEDTIFAAGLRLIGPWRMVNEPLVAKRVRAGQASTLTWHAIWNAQTRVQFCRDHAGALGESTARDIEGEIWDRIVSALERRYWRRDLTDLAGMRDKLRELCPDHLGRSFLANARIHPRWVYYLKDRFSRKTST